MTTGSTDQLLTYLADLIEQIERYGAVVLPPNDREDVAWATDGQGNLVLDVAAQPPAPRQVRASELIFQERWRATGTGAWFRFEYGYELRDFELDYRFAFHRHDADRFAERYEVLTHQHCEAAMGRPVCNHYFAEPIRDARDAFERLYDLWLTRSKPDCSSLVCLERSRL